MRPRYLILFLTAVFLGVPAPASAGDKPRAKVYKTPQAVFDDAVQTGKSGKWKEFCDCLTPDAQKMLAGTLVLMGAEMRKALNDLAEKEKDSDKRAVMMTVMKELLKPMMKVYARHGVSEEALDKSGGMMKLLFTAGDPEKLKKLLRDEARPVKDSATFITELMT